jgi:hypothetical protein
MNTGVCGRPFLVAGVARRAGVIPRDDWASSLDPDTGALCADDRALLAEHWAEIGSMEHASVAAFARFTLELLSLGAPADLVTASQRALADEIAHARLAFGLASAYAERPLGPGALRLDGALAESVDIVAIVRQTFVETCVGETCAAVEARAAALEASDPRVREVLERIAADELRHAELGYRFVKWSLDRASTVLRRTLVTALETALAERLGDNPAPSSRKGIPSHGLLADAELRRVRDAALTEVVLPCCAALFGSMSAVVTKARRPAENGAWYSVSTRGSRP